MQLKIDDHLPADAYIRLPEVMRQTALGRATIYARAKAGRFPAPRKLTERASGWLVGDIREWKADPLNWRAPTSKAVTCQGNDNAGNGDL